MINTCALLEKPKNLQHLIFETKKRYPRNSIKLSVRVIFEKLMKCNQYFVNLCLQYFYIKLSLNIINIDQLKNYGPVHSLLTSKAPLPRCHALVCMLQCMASLPRCHALVCMLQCMASLPRCHALVCMQQCMASLPKVPCTSVHALVHSIIAKGAMHQCACCSAWHHGQGAMHQCACCSAWYHCQGAMHQCASSSAWHHCQTVPCMHQCILCNVHTVV